MQKDDLNFVFQHADSAQLRGLFKKIEVQFVVEVLQQPTTQTLLQPVLDPISQSYFYAGEILVTTTIVQVEHHKGWAMVMDDNEELSLMIAVVDACYDKGLFLEDIDFLYTQTMKKIDEKKEIENKKIDSTRVSFDLMQG